MSLKAMSDKTVSINGCRVSVTVNGHVCHPASMNGSGIEFNLCWLRCA